MSEEMSPAEFYRLTNKENVNRKWFIRMLQMSVRSGHVYFEKAGRELPEQLAKAIVGTRFAPIYDRTFNVVLQVSYGHHEGVRSLLEYYHSNDPKTSFFDSGDLWLKNKRGFYISCENTKQIIVAEGYTPIRHEKDVFKIFKVEEVPF